MPSYRFDEKQRNYTIGNEVPIRDEPFGLPSWMFHPVEALKCFFGNVMTELEDYGTLPMTIIGGGLAIYYLRKTPTL